MSGPKEKRAVAETSLLLHERGWVANHDGNVSLRSDRDRFLITPTATSKRLCSADTIVECKADGEPIGSGRPPSEVALHVAAYRARADVSAVIHAHPPYASAFALCEVPIAPLSMPEVIVSLGESVPLVRRLLPKDPETGAAVGQALLGADVLLLAGNGVLAVGPDLETAYLRLELLEHYAQILSIARGRIGDPALLSEAERGKLIDMRKKAGLHREPEKPKAAVVSNVNETLRAVVAEEVRRALGGKS